MKRKRKAWKRNIILKKRKCYIKELKSNAWERNIILRERKGNASERNAFLGNEVSICIALSLPGLRKIEILI